MQEVLNRKLGHLAGMLPDVHKLSEHDLLLGHKRYYTVGDRCVIDIEQSGYVIKLFKGIALKPLTTQQMLSLNLDDRIIDALYQVGINYPELACGILAELQLPN